MEDLVAKEPHRTDFRVDLAISCWNMFGICPEADELRWLNQAKAILEPIRDAGLLHGQLEELWGYVEKELGKRAEP